MIGILATGIGIPAGRYRIGGEERAIAGPDEDAVTLAVAAADSCFTETDPGEVGAVYLATNSSPLPGHSLAALVSRLSGVPGEVRTLDFSGSPRVGATALFAALDAVESGSVGRVLVIGTDTPTAAPGDRSEELLGAGAVALLVGDGGAAGAVTSRLSVSGASVEAFVPDLEGRLEAMPTDRLLHLGHGPSLTRAIRLLFRRDGFDTQSFSRVVMASPDRRLHLSVGRALGFDARALLQSDPLLSVGYTGAAHALLLLAHILETADAGERILWCAAGGGADLAVVEIESPAQYLKRTGTVRRAQASGFDLREDEVRFLRNIDRRVAPVEEPPWEDLGERFFDLLGGSCSTCGASYSISPPACPACGEVDGFRPLTLSRFGSVLSFTREWSLDPGAAPTTLAQVDLQGDSRMLLRITDSPEESVKVGASVQLVLRRRLPGDGGPVYLLAARTVEVSR